MLYVDSLSEADGPVPTYLDLLRVTSETIAKGLAAMNDAVVLDRSRRAGAADDARAGIAVEGVTVTYRNGLTALRDASFAIPTGTITALVGVNGSGKSTLFKAIMGFVPLAKGSIRILGRPVDAGAQARISSPMCRRARRSTGTSRCWSRTW